MKFFDQKEDVLDIQLTQYGKKLLASGDFEPTYYAFFDNDIIYHSAYSSRYEEQNDIHNRITAETPRLKAQYKFHGVNSFYSSTDDDSITPENNYSLGLPLGTSTMGSENAPAWQTDFLYGELTGAVQQVTGSNIKYFTIPQLKSEIEFETYITKLDSEGDYTKSYMPPELEGIAFDMLEEIVGVHGDDEEEIFVADDRTILQVIPDFLLLELSEENTQFLTDNFEIEVYEVEHKKDPQTGSDIRVERQLEFYDFDNQTEPLGPKHVEYYINIDSDKEIPAEFFCAAPDLQKKKRSRIADNMLPYPVNCPDYKQYKNLYISETDEIEEPC